MEVLVVSASTRTRSANLGSVTNIVPSETSFDLLQCQFCPSDTTKRFKGIRSLNIHYNKVHSCNQSHEGVTYLPVDSLTNVSHQNHRGTAHLLANDNQQHQNDEASHPADSLQTGPSSIEARS